MMTSKAWRDSARASFSPSRSRRRQKEALLSDCWKVENNTMKIQGKPKKESPKNVAIKYLLLLNIKLMAEKARRRREWHLEFKRFRLCMV